MEIKIYADCCFVPDLGVVEYLSSGEVLRNDLNNCIKSFGSIEFELALSDFNYAAIYSEVKSVVDKAVDVNALATSAISKETVKFIKLLRKEARKWKFTQSMDLCESGDVYTEAGIFTDVVSVQEDGENLRERLFAAISEDYVGQLATQIYRAYKTACEDYLPNICSQHAVVKISLKSVTDVMSWYQALALTTESI